MMNNILRTESIHVSYGHVKALHDFSMEVGKGETVAVLGANGAGKSTLLNAIMGITKTSSGDIFFKDRRINRLPPHDICKMGIGYVPEGRRVFAELTVQENLQIGAYTLRDKGRQQKLTDYVYETFPILLERKRQSAGTLSGGEQQMLALGRALMTGPSLLLLDEPSMGLAPIVIKDIFHALRKINQEGTTVLLIEQSAYLALKVSTRAYVIESGRLILHDTVENLGQDPAMKRSYLGM